VRRRAGDRALARRAEFTKAPLSPNFAAQTEPSWSSSLDPKSPASDCDSGSREPLIGSTSSIDGKKW